MHVLAWLHQVYQNHTQLLGLVWQLYSKKSGEKFAIHKNTDTQNYLTNLISPIFLYPNMPQFSASLCTIFSVLPWSMDIYLLNGNSIRLFPFSNLKIIPVATQVKNYCPILLISNTSKVLEWIIYDKTIDHIASQFSLASYWTAQQLRTSYPFYQMHLMIVISSMSSIWKLVKPSTWLHK